MRRTLDRLEADQRALMVAMQSSGGEDMESAVEQLERQFSESRAQIIEALSPERDTLNIAVLADGEDVGVWWTPTAPMGGGGIGWDVEKVRKRFRPEE